MLDSVVSGTVTVVATGSVTLGADASLRVTASGSTITCYHGTDGVPGAWTQLAQVTNSTLSVGDRRRHNHDMVANHLI